MGLLSIITAPDEKLRKKSEPVISVTKNTQSLMKDMLSTMYHAKGVGLAAVQVGIHKNIMVIDLQDYSDIINENPEIIYPLYIVNPIITNIGDAVVSAEEGCLSLPDQKIEIPRHEKIKVKYLDFYGKKQKIEFHGWLARVIQHEYDHLQGKLLVDYLSKLKRDISLRKLSKLKKDQIL